MTAQINTTTSLSLLLQNIGTVLTSRIESVDYIAVDAKKEAINIIKNLENVEISLFDDSLPKLLRNSKVTIYLINIFWPF